MMMWRVALAANKLKLKDARHVSCIPDGRRATCLAPGGGFRAGGTFRFKRDEPDHPNNDRLIFSKGHASRLYRRPGKEGNR
jgi:hypothetical protein